MLYTLACILRDVNEYAFVMMTNHWSPYFVFCCLRLGFSCGSAVDPTWQVERSVLMGRSTIMSGKRHSPKRILSRTMQQRLRYPCIVKIQTWQQRVCMPRRSHRIKL